jgi:hypothetical protein
MGTRKSWLALAANNQTHSRRLSNSTIVLSLAKLLCFNCKLVV